jgi:hypothetical protein
LLNTISERLPLIGMPSAAVGQHCVAAPLCSYLFVFRSRTSG